MLSANLSFYIYFFQVEFILHSSDVDRAQIQAIHVILNVSNLSISSIFNFDFFILHKIYEEIQFTFMLPKLLTNMYRLG